MISTPIHQFSIKSTPMFELFYGENLHGSSWNDFSERKKLVNPNFKEILEIRSSLS